ACDHWVEPDWLVGNVLKEDFHSLAHSEIMRRFARKKRIKLTAQCRRCPYLRMCNGGCPKDRFVKSVDGQEGQNYL
ncbi:SPASM domain-containing protein, partial [Fusicatenibacter saccharivorans]|nr:SPASM domain-containing protein [Fusicatenibacter saccharivorans]